MVEGARLESVYVERHRGFESLSHRQMPMDIAFVYVIKYIFNMKTTSVTELRRNLSATINDVASDHEPVLITRSGGKSAVVLIALDDFASYEETSYLLRSPGNSERLRTAIAELDAGKGEEHTLIE